MCIRDSPQPSLVSSLGALGYDKTAFHPYYGNNWSRDVVYPYLGFDRYVDIGALLGEDLVACLLYTSRCV